MSKEQLTRNREQLAVIKEQLARNGKQNCTDCLHCKVSVKSTEKRRLCYCATTNREKRHNVSYWEKKKVCIRFDDMAVIEPVRRPLLRRRA